YGLKSGGIGGKDGDLKEILGRATPADIKEAIRELTGKISKGELDKVKDWLKKTGASMPEMPKVITIGTSSGELPVDQEVVEYYKDLATHYPLVVTKKVLEAETSIRTWSAVERWRPGVDPSMALPGSSGGMLLPGITKSIKIAEMPVKTTDYKVPHLLVVIDSSGSMPHPKQLKSYAVLGGYCAALSYHIQEAHIGVINFSGDSFYLPYTRELNHALGAISAYQGGGTTVDVEMVRKMLGPEMAELYSSRPDRNMRDLPREFMRKDVSLGIPDEIFKAESIDVLMFTDGGISNLEHVLALFEEKAELNRATIVLTHGFAQELADRKDSRIQVHRIEDIKDIPNIVIREVGKNFDARLEAIR
ncbi:MAG: VWA domain-containing protein, partial [Candidatus ainarchaeum sp.]|nr:VWA domain-containing protein [Candidatus ainarchaeum sp.]